MSEEKPKRPASWTLILDVEAVVDEQLVRDVYERSPDERLADLREVGSRARMLPAWCYRPVAVVLAVVAEDWTIRRLEPLPGDSPEALAAEFWGRLAAMDESKKKWEIITYNGARFDLPLLEMEAWRSGVVVPGWFVPGEKSWLDPRSRACSKHVDLAEQVTAFNRSGFDSMPPLRAMSATAGGPRMLCGPDGQDVARLWASGDTGREAVVGHCLADVLDTYLVALRLARLAGKVTAEREDELRRRLVDQSPTGAVAEVAARWPAVEEWIDKFGDRETGRPEFLAYVRKAGGAS